MSTTLEHHNINASQNESKVNLTMHVLYKTNPPKAIKHAYIHNKVIFSTCSIWLFGSLDQRPVCHNYHFVDTVSIYVYDYTTVNHRHAACTFDVVL